MDLILKNARRVGAEDQLTDIGIAGGRIAAIEPGLAAEGETIDVGGRLVSPGFVETRNHWAGTKTFAFRDRLFEEVLDLTVDAAEFVLGPTLQLGPELRIDPQQKRFP